MTGGKLEKTRKTLRTSPVRGSRARRPGPGATIFRRWARAQGLTYAEVSVAIGDAGGQLHKWTSGSRKTLPIPLLIRLVAYSGIPFRWLATATQLKLARALVATLREPGTSRTLEG